MIVCSSVLIFGTTSGFVNLWFSGSISLRPSISLESKSRFRFSLFISIEGEVIAIHIGVKI